MFESIFIVGMIAIIVISLRWFLDKNSRSIDNSASLAPPCTSPAPAIKVSQNAFLGDFELFEALVIQLQKRSVERTFYTTVAGTSHKNDDGTSRIAAIRKCERGEVLQMLMQPNNPYDPNAIAVFFEQQQLGYLNARLAGQISRDWKRNGSRHQLYFFQATRHPETNKVVGATMLVLRFATPDTA